VCLTRIEMVNTIRAGAHRWPRRDIDEPEKVSTASRAQASPAPGHTSRRFTLQRHQPVLVVVLQAADHRGHAAQGGLGADAGGFAQGDELWRDFDEQDVGLLEHDGIP
jgi:hypothetical protein